MLGMRVLSTRWLASIWHPVGRSCRVRSEAFSMQEQTQAGKSAPELYGLPISPIDIPLPALEARMVYEHIVHAIQVAMKVAHLRAPSSTRLQPFCADRRCI